MLHSPAHRCLDVLELLAEAPDGLALSMVGSRLSIPKSATHRFLALLAERGYVRQDPRSQRYMLTYRLPALAFRFIAATGVTDVAQPVLDALAARTGELARLAVVDGEMLTWVAKAQGAARGLRYDDQAGREVILHATASGKVWLASLPEPAALAIVERAEGEPGVVAVAAAVRSHVGDGAPVAATVSIAGPLARLDAARRAALASEAIAAAAELTELWPARERLGTSAAA
jgi:DNA-binding IclR family transcriptional regulator